MRNRARSLSVYLIVVVAAVLLAWAGKRPADAAVLSVCFDPPCNCFSDGYCTSWPSGPSCERNSNC